MNDLKCWIIVLLFMMVGLAAIGPTTSGAEAASSSGLALVSGTPFDRQLNLAQERPTVPPPPTPVPPRPTLGPIVPSRSPEICLRLTAHPNKTTAPAHIVTYQLVAENIGKAGADGIQATFPVAVGLQKVLDVTFTHPQAWVSAVRPGEMDMQLGTLDAAAIMTATVRLQTKPDADQGSNLITHARLNWAEQKDQAATLSNHVTVAVADVSASSSTESLGISPTAGPPSTIFMIVYSGLASHERVSLWYHDQGNQPHPLDDLRADEQGNFAVKLPADGLPYGKYLLVAYGTCSHVTAVGSFTITTE